MMRNITLRQMRVFAAVAQQRSFTRAARELHLTQPAVSQQLKSLESEVGLPLLEYVGRNIHLTAAGEELLRYSTQINELLRDAGEAFAGMRGLKRGILKLGAVSTAKYFAPSLLSAFTAEYPQVTIKFTVGNREEIIEQLASNASDLVIMGRPPRELVTTAEPFAKHPLVMIASPDHPLVGSKRKIPVKQLASQNFVIREEGSGTRASMEHVFREHGVAFRASMEVSSNETIKQSVMAGMGISFISRHTVSLELAAGKLAILNVSGLPVLRDWYVIHMQDKRLSPITAAFRSFMLKRGAEIIEKTVGEGGSLRPRTRLAAPGL